MRVRGWTLEELGEEACLALAYLLAGGDPPRSVPSFQMASALRDAGLEWREPLPRLAARLVEIAGRRGLGQGWPMLPDDRPDPEQLEILRRLTPEQRWRAAHRLYWTVRRHSEAFLRAQHPEWSGEEVEREVRRRFLHART